MDNKNNINIELLTRGHGATVACLTPDQQVGGSNPSVLRLFFYKKSYNKGIRLIKKYVFKLYKLMKETLKEISSEDEQDA